MSIFNGKFKFIIITSFVLVTTLFFQYSNLVEMIAHQSNMWLGHNYPTHSHFMPCCDLKIPISSMAHNIVILSQSIDDLFKYMIIFFAGLISFFFLSGNMKKIIDNYFYVKKIRELYGSWSFFNFLIRLFRVGILQPKIF